MQEFSNKETRLLYLARRIGCIVPRNKISSQMAIIVFVKISKRSKSRFCIRVNEKGKTNKK